MCQSWLLGSSTFSAQLAAELGFCSFAFAGQFRAANDARSHRGCIEREFQTVSDTEKILCHDWIAGPGGGYG